MSLPTTPIPPFNTGDRVKFIGTNRRGVVRLQPGDTARVMGLADSFPNIFPDGPSFWFLFDDEPNIPANSCWLGVVADWEPIPTN